ncbi:TPA: 50S ribosomal protein L22 [Candidatus Berkelbacteria bacterium]|uniref:50S ribosomal protein L22 n=1 Tax=Berkelbacteria bacterium GW2011_GWE1_39_12 TaxID=1618337 RepID=A0A0G4B513_9BACT|nr:MAG: LSU ribosomal protein L22p, L17e [Berkelbacteria bacterium GW2011_GWE1_39_12]HBO60223.1 50S ribosomal protein L22 [Candidatus Berkelbacteria bacterium]
MNFISKQRFSKIAPDKIRILSSMIKGQKVDWALAQLEFSGKIGSKSLINAIKQAMDQVKVKGLNIDDFRISTTQVDEGPKLKRRRIRHQGRSTMILKRMSHVAVILTDEIKPKAKKETTKEVVATKGSK